MLLVVMFCAVYLANGQQIKPSASGYAPVNGTQVYYMKCMEKEGPLLLHGAFMTIEMNWGQLIPEICQRQRKK